jgi:hypothetical protein
MQRNWDLIRGLMLKLETMSASGELLSPEDMSHEGGYESGEVYQHLMMLGEAGLAEIMDAAGQNAVASCYGKRLTWEGCEFLELIRGEADFGRIKTLMTERQLPQTVSTIRQISIRLVDSKLKDM